MLLEEDVEAAEEAAEEEDLTLDTSNKNHIIKRGENTKMREKKTKKDNKNIMKEEKTAEIRNKTKILITTSISMGQDQSTRESQSLPRLKFHL